MEWAIIGITSLVAGVVEERAHGSLGIGRVSAGAARARRGNLALLAWLRSAYNGNVRVRTIGRQELQIPSLDFRRLRNAVFRRLCHSLGGDESLPPVNNHGRSYDVAVICSAG